MTPNFRQALRILGWTWKDAGNHLAKGRRTVARYASTNRVPSLVERELQRRMADKDNKTPPAKPTRRGPFT